MATVRFEKKKGLAPVTPLKTRLAHAHTPTHPGVVCADFRPSPKSGCLEDLEGLGLSQDQPRMAARVAPVLHLHEGQCAEGERERERDRERERERAGQSAESAAQDSWLLVTAAIADAVSFKPQTTLND